VMCCAISTILWSDVPGEIVGDVHTEDLETADLLHLRLTSVNGGVSTPSPEVHDHLIGFAVFEREVVVRAPAGKCFHLFSVGLLVVVRDETHENGCVVSKLYDDVGAVFGNTVVGEQGVQRLSTHPCGAPVLRWRCVFRFSPPTHQEVEHPVADEGLQSEIDKRQDEFGGNCSVEC